MRHDKAVDLIRLAQLMAASAEGLTLDDIRREMDCSRRTAERLRDAVAASFPQMEEVPDPPWKRYRIPRGLGAMFLAPTPGELAELSVAAEGLRATGATARAESLASLDRKLRSAMRRETLRRFAPDIEALAEAEMIAIQAGPRPHEDERLLGRIREAIMAMRALAFVYRGGSTPGAVREVVPYGIMFGRANYLVAAKLGSTHPQNYRLDRIDLDTMRVLDVPAAPPEGFSLKDYAARSFGIYQDAAEDVVLRVAPARADEALRWRFHASQTTEPQPDGAVIVRFRASGLLELCWHLFTWQRDIEILAPATLRDQMIAELSAALGHHSGTTV